MHDVFYSEHAHIFWKLAYIVAIWGAFYFGWRRYKRSTDELFDQLRETHRLFLDRGEQLHKLKWRISEIEALLGKHDKKNRLSAEEKRNGRNKKRTARVE